MRFVFTEEQEIWRREVRKFFSEQITDEVRKEYYENREGFPYKLWGKLVERNWVGLGVPQEYDGLGKSHFEIALFLEELTYADAPAPLYCVYTTTFMLCEVLHHFASEDLKKRIFSEIVKGNGKPAWGFTEPEAGSDLGACQSKAIREGDFYVTTGTKIFNFAHYCDYILTLCRTSFDIPYYKGMSLFLIDLKSPGITINPIWLIDRERRNEVHFDAVKVPVDNRIGDENKGWECLLTGLNFERYILAETGGIISAFEKILHLIENRETISQNSSIRSSLAEIAKDLEMTKLIFYRAVWLREKGQLPLKEAIMARLLGAEVRWKLTNVGMDSLGLASLLEEETSWTLPEQFLCEHYRGAKALWAIAGGTLEVLRNTIASAELKLPR